MNGRLPKTNDYTYIMFTGKSVVGYALIPHEQLQFYEDFNVLTMTDLINVHNLHPPDVISDHSLLIWTTVLPKVEMDTESETNIDDQIQIGDQFNMTYKRYSIKTIPVDFLESESMRKSINEAIRRIESSIDREEGIDNTYSEFVNLVIGELDK